MMPPKQRAPLPWGKGARVRMDRLCLLRSPRRIEYESAATRLALDQPHLSRRPAAGDVPHGAAASGTECLSAHASRPVQPGGLIQRESAGEVPARALDTRSLPDHGFHYGPVAMEGP